MPNTQHTKVNKPFAVFDIDGTLIRWQLYHAVAESLAKLGHINPEMHQIIREARMQWKKRVSDEAFKDYEKVLIGIYDQLLTKLSVKLFDEAATKVFNEYKDQAYRYTRDLITSLKKKNYVLFAISGSQREIVALIARHYGFDDFVGSIYTQEKGVFTGEKTVAAQSKRAILQQLIEKHGVSSNHSIAVGDSESDIPMLEMVEQPIAFNPDKTLFRYAKEKGWKVVVERKNVVYEVEQRDGTYILV